MNGRIIYIYTNFQFLLLLIVFFLLDCALSHFNDKLFQKYILYKIFLGKGSNIGCVHDKNLTFSLSIRNYINKIK